MVSFITITQGVIFTASLLMFGASHAAPATGIKKSLSSSSVGPLHVNATTATPFKLPPIISSRAKPVTHPAHTGDLNAEADSIKKNKQWYQDHGGNFTEIADKRDSNTVAGMTLVLPSSGVPPVQKISSTNTVVTASAAQINTFKFYAAVASTAYCTSVVPSNSWSCGNCLSYVPDGKLIVTFTSSGKDINGFVLRSDSQKTIYLVFRGTSSFENWIVNLDYTLTNYSPVSGAQVHKGFYNAYTEVSTYFYSQLLGQIAAYPNYKVVVTGHSLGGAQALLAGMDLYQRVSSLSSNNLFIYTVGCPRVGNPNFAYYIENTGITVSRSVHNRDLVPHVPPESFGFLHPGVETWDKSDTDVEICTDDIESSSCSDSIVPFTSISDHKTYYDIQEGTCV